MTTDRECDLPSCKIIFTAQTSRARWCSNACRAKGRALGLAGPRRKAEQPPANVTSITPSRAGASTDFPAAESPPRRATDNEAAVRAELEAVDQVESALGQAALTLARQLDGQHYSRDTGSAVAAVVRELRTTLEAAKDAGRPKVPSRPEEIVDEVARRRAEHAARGA